jgi:hypothetical protein
MHSHPNARLMPISREHLIRRHLNEGEPLKALAAQAGISLRSAEQWPAWYRTGGVATLADARSAATAGGCGSYSTQRYIGAPEKGIRRLDPNIANERRVVGPNAWLYSGQ